MLEEYFFNEKIKVVRAVMSQVALASIHLLNGWQQ